MTNDEIAERLIHNEVWNFTTAWLSGTLQLGEARVALKEAIIKALEEKELAMTDWLEDVPNDL